MSENVTRSISGVIFISLLVFCTLYDEITFVSLFSLFTGIAVYEFCKLVKLDLKPSLLLAGASIVLGVILDTHSLNNNLMLVIATVLVLLRLLFNLFDLKNTNFIATERLGKFIQLLGYVIFPFIIIMKLPHLLGTFSPKIVLGIFILIWTNDTFAYIFGKYLGKHKLFEKVSPKKTIEGFVGGLVVCLGVSYILSMYFDFLTPLQWFVTAIIMSVMGTLGDLVESKFKRSAGVKDSGNIMPGHGGILDRLDSVIFATPFLYLILFFIS